MELFTYFRSTASYRVRLALAYKQIPYNSNYVNLRTGEQNLEYKKINPFGLVPALATESGLISQSLAIVEYIEKMHPTPPLFFKDPFQQSQAMAIALAISCDIHPLNNLKVLNYLTNILKISDAEKTNWYHHWIHEGFQPIEQILQQTSGDFCIDDNISVADICLIPQVYNAHRFKVDMSAYPIITKINQKVLSLEWAKQASPEEQSDASF